MDPKGLPRCVMRNEQEQDSSPLVPIEQQPLLFYGKLLVVVRLPDRRPAIVLRHICENLQLEPTSQVRRFKRTEVIADDLVYTQIQTDGGQRRSASAYILTPRRVYFFMDVTACTSSSSVSTRFHCKDARGATRSSPLESTANNSSPTCSKRSTM
jgi:hypothetical protein